MAAVLLAITGARALPAVQTATDPDQGLVQLSGDFDPASRPPAQCDFHSWDSRLGTLWDFEDPDAIVSGAALSEVTGNTFIGWELNDERVSLYGGSAVPLWEDPVENCDWDVIVDMVPDGSLMAVVDGALVRIYTPDSPVPTCELVYSTQPNGMALSPDGALVYTAQSYDNGDSSTVSCREIDGGDLVWTRSFLGGSETLVLSGDGNRLLFTQYGGPSSALWALDTAAGAILYQGPNRTQFAPVLSHDGAVMARGDYSGFLFVYLFDEENGTYEESWHFHVGGGGTSVWCCGVAVAADGSTIAVGTLVFFASSYDGEIYLFNTQSPQPLWVYENVGDAVVDLDLSAEGGILAAASWGPLDHSTADFLLFRRESALPIYTIDTPGSMMAVDLSPDASLCAVGGKAVHARQMGNGGLLFSVESDPGGGSLAGNVLCDGADSQAGARVSLLELVDFLAYTDSDGDYAIEYIPTGTYTAQASRIGYGTVTAPVTISAGETTEQDFTLYANGCPPSGLTATQGAGLEIVLSWQEPPTDDYLGFNVYRKRYPPDPYPETPLVTLEASELSWVDTEVAPTRVYYYVVTSILPGDLQSPFSNEAAGWASSGFLTDEVPVWYGPAPVIDGIISEGEWDDAYRLECSDFLGTYDNSEAPVGSVQGFFKCNEELTELYVACFNLNDTVLEDHDEIGLYIDDNNDGHFPPADLFDDSEGNYWAAYYASGSVIKYRPLYDSGGAGTVFYLDDPQIAVSVDAGYLVYEFVLPLGEEDWEIDPDANGQSGFFNFTLDDPDEFDGWWPAAALNPFDPGQYGTLTFGAEPQVPPPPAWLTWFAAEGGVLLAWEMPELNDFDHFNLWLSQDGEWFELLQATIGVQYFCELNDTGTYWFRVTTVNQLGMESEPSETIEVYYDAVAPQQALPERVELRANYPNPFNPTTTIEFTLPHPQEIRLEVYNVLGQRVVLLAEGVHTAGVHRVRFNGSEAASGVYLYRLISEGGAVSRKMILVR